MTITYIDGYKTDHRRQYPEGTTLVYSNWTPRKSRISYIDRVTLFGLQYFMEEYLIRKFNEDFFQKSRDEAVRSYSKLMDSYLGPGAISTEHIESLYDLGYVPIEIRSVMEGEEVPIGVPMLTLHNTVPEFFWMTNYLETIMSCILWQPCTSATLAKYFRRMLNRHCEKTNPEARDFVPWQGHDFSFRGMSSFESACLSGAGHLLSFTGTDTIPAIQFLEKYYEADSSKELIGGSVSASEHSCMSLGQPGNEFQTFKRFITELYPKGIVSIVSDTWNLWQVVTDFLPRLKNEILARDGKVVIRPDSSRTGPEDIICGTPASSRTWSYSNPDWNKAEEQGLIQCLWNTFGGTTSSTGYKVLDSHIGAIYGDAINYERANNICERLAARGFASTNLVYGVGSYTYQYNTRDTFGFAMKATYGVVNGEPRSIFKDPITDSGEKKSACGLIQLGKDFKGDYMLLDNQSTANGGYLKPVFRDGKILQSVTLNQVRKNVCR